MTEKSRTNDGADGRRGRPARPTRPEEILAAGFREFAEKGFQATRLEDIAARAGVAKGTVYLYFADKEALFEAAVRSRIAPVIEQAGAAAAIGGLDTADALRAIVRAMYARVGEPEVRTILRILIADGARFPQLIRFYHREVVAKMIAALEAIIQRGIERGELTGGAITRAPAVLIAPVLMAALWQMTFATEQAIPVEQFEAAHLDLLERCLRA